MAGQRLFLLCGLPFSGKSTMGRALAAQLGIAHIEVDRVHADRLMPSAEDRIERAEWIEAYRIAYGWLEEALKRGESAVFDAVSYRKLQRHRIARIAARFEVPMTVIHLDVPLAESRRRRDANRANPVRPHVPSADLDEVAQGMQPPGDDEDVRRYRADEPLERWIAREIAPLLAELPIKNLSGTVAVPVD